MNIPYIIYKDNTVELKEQPFVFYIHPWEVDPGQPEVTGISRFSKFRHYNNLDKCDQRLEKLLNDFKFDTMKNVLTDLGLFDKAA